MVAVAYVFFITDDVERVQVSGLSAALRSSFQPSSSDLNGVVAVNLRGLQQKKRVAVLVSGSGTLPLLFRIKMLEQIKQVL